MLAPDLSVVFGTFNRRASLERCVESVRRSVGLLDTEVIVVDGGSTDGTRDYLLDLARAWLADGGSFRVEPIFEAKRRGAVAAFNAGFAATRAPIIALLNDDVEVDGAALEFAHAFLTTCPDVGQVALAYKRPEAQTHRTYTIHGKTYANLAVLRREAALDAVAIQGGLWNPRYHTYAADTELSCWLHRLGWRVEPLPDARCTDYEIEDILRAENNSGRNRLDSMAFGRRWPSARHLEPDGPLPRVSEEELEALERVRTRRKPS